MGCRAAVRAIVTADRGGALADPQCRKSIADYLELALACALPPPPRLIAVGGFSGTGKSTLAAAIAPGIGARPGAVHLRSDLERKSLLGAAETRRLDDAAYGPDVTARVYDILLRKARHALAAGHAAIIDAVHAREDERAAVAALAARLRVPFQGLWLTAPERLLAARVTARTGDASDATARVVARQLGHGAGRVTWQTIDASSSQEATLALARRFL
jgi:predicted kinase